MRGSLRINSVLVVAAVAAWVVVSGVRDRLALERRERGRVRPSERLVTSSDRLRWN
jgi:hypothetical protein